MRSQTPIQQQRTTQTQLSRSRPHNPSLVRRIKPSGQRASPLRKMQQQTRQRQARQRQSTPLSEKRGGTRQTTRSRHADTTLQHMVNHTPPFHNPQHNTTKQDNTRQALSSQQGGMQTVSSTHPPFSPTQPPPLFHNDTTLQQRHGTKPTML